MIYTVSSHGRPIGITDLGFARIGGPSRSGWFHPNEEGRELMPAVASSLPAMRAYLHRDYRDEHGASVLEPSFVGSTLFADIAQAFQQLRSFELTLHREDGSLVSTELVGIQVIDHESHFEHMNAALDEEEPWEAPDPLEAAEWEETFKSVRDSLRKAYDVLAAEMLARGMADEIPKHVPDDEKELPRYQVHVLLSDDAAVP